MTKKKLRILIGLGMFIILLFAIIYWFYFSKPTSFPTNEQSIEEINSFFPDAVANVIQDIIYLDERHVLVPFISEENNYSLSYWKWGGSKWEVASVHSRGEPMLWKVDKRDPTSYHFVWNIHPDDNMSKLDFYLIRDRGYRAGEVERYNPRIQLEKHASLQKKTYGAIKLPQEWVKVIDESLKIESTDQNAFFAEVFYTNYYPYFNWITYDEVGKSSLPEHSVNGYHTGNIDLQYMGILVEDQIEKPNQD